MAPTPMILRDSGDGSAIHAPARARRGTTALALALAALVPGAASAADLPDPDIFDGSLFEPDPPSPQNPQEAVAQQQAANASAKGAQSAENAQGPNAEKKAEQQDQAQAKNEGATGGSDSEAGGGASGGGKAGEAAEGGGGPGTPPPGGEVARQGEGAPAGAPGGDDKDAPPPGPGGTIALGGAPPEEKDKGAGPGGDLPGPDAGGEEVDGAAVIVEGDPGRALPELPPRPPRTITIGDPGSVIIVTAPKDGVGGQAPDPDDIYKVVGTAPKPEVKPEKKEPAILNPVRIIRSNRGNSRGVEQGETLPSDL